jgi:hypothetical protein
LTALAQFVESTSIVAEWLRVSVQVGPPDARYRTEAPPRSRDGGDTVQGLPIADGVIERPARPWPPEPVASPLAHLMLARARRRCALPLDVISFVSACPACGEDSEWIQTRQETRVRSTIHCPCARRGAG